jgi:hypothetical protein
VSAAVVFPEMIKGRPPRLDEILQSSNAPLFFIMMCTIHREELTIWMQFTVPSRNTSLGHE